MLNISKSININLFQAKTRKSRHAFIECVLGRIHPEKESSLAVPPWPHHQQFQMLQHRQLQ